MGIASTVMFSLLFLLLRDWLPVMAASVLALLLSTVVNTAVNRRFTFGIRGGHSVVRHQFQGLVVLGMALILTSGAIWLLHAVNAAPSRTAEVVVLTAANLAATVLRFVLFRGWVFNRKGSAS